MNKVKGTMDVRLSLEEVNTINELIERDTARAEKVDGKYDLAYCPICSSVTVNSYTFCPRCGQRLDHENRAL